MPRAHVVQSSGDCYHDKHPDSLICLSPLLFGYHTPFLLHDITRLNMFAHSAQFPEASLMSVYQRHIYRYDLTILLLQHICNSLRLKPCL